jgi:hypothetical protein
MKESYREKEDKYNQESTEKKKNLNGRVDEQMIIRKESNMIASVKHQTPKMNKGEKNEYTLYKTTRRKTK